MGQDKAALSIGGNSLLARSVALLEPFTRSTHVAIRRDQADDQLRLQFDVLIDDPAASGPAGGLLAAWRFDPATAWLVLACDMPGLDRMAMEVLTGSRDASCGGTAWANADDGLPEPLCAIWEPATLARLAELVAKPGVGPVSPRVVLAGSRPHLLNPVRAEALASLNTPADLRHYLESPYGLES